MPLATSLRQLVQQIKDERGTTAETQKTAKAIADLKTQTADAVKVLKKEGKDFADAEEE